MINSISKIYNWLEDEQSKEIYLQRLNYLITNDISYMYKISEKYCREYINSEKGWKGNFICDGIKSAGLNVNEVILYGAGYIAEQLLENARWIDGIEIKFFCDKNELKQQQGFKKCKVISPDELFANYNNEPIIICTNKFYDEIVNELINTIPKENIFNYAEYKILDHDPKQYFYEPFLEYGNEEILLDVGAYDLASTLALKKRCPGLVKSYAFEPEPSNFNICRNRIKNEKLDYIELFPYGTWSKKTSLFYYSEGSGSHVIKNGSDKIDVIAIDDAISGAVTFIKMDVEGSELESLKGARKTIQEYKPKLAICIYHKPEDMIEIPMYIKSIVPEYKFYVRHYSSYEGETVLFAV